MSEYEIQTQCFEILKKLGIHYYHKEKGARVAKAHSRGWPDVIFGTDGRIYVVEFKTAKGLVAEEQKEWLTRIEKHWGGRTAIIRSREEFLDKLTEWGVISKHLFRGTR